MITLFENLFDREIINLPSGTGGNFFLKEPARPDYPGYTLQIRGLSKRAYMIGIDEHFNVDSIFGSCHSQAKRPDYLIIDPDNSVACVIELKGTDNWNTLRRPDIVSQLKGGEAFLKYCEILIKTFVSSKSDDSCESPCRWCDKEYESHGYKIRYICIYGLGARNRINGKNKYAGAGAPKRRVGPPRNRNAKSNNIENTPDKFAKLGPADLHFSGDSECVEIHWSQVLGGDNN